MIPMGRNGVVAAADPCHRDTTGGCGRARVGCLRAARADCFDPSMMNRSLGTSFTRLWSAYAVSTFGTYLALDALP